MDLLRLVLAKQKIENLARFPQLMRSLPFHHVRCSIFQIDYMSKISASQFVTLYALRGELTPDLHVLVGSTYASCRALFRLDVRKYRLYTYDKRILLDFWGALRTGVPEIQARAIAYCIKEPINVMGQLCVVGDILKVVLLSIPWTKQLCHVILKSVVPLCYKIDNLVSLSSCDRATHVVEEFLKTFLDPNHVPDPKANFSSYRMIGACASDLKETVVKKSERVERIFAYSPSVRGRPVNSFLLLTFIEIGYLNPIIELLKKKTDPELREKLSRFAVKFVRKELFPPLAEEVKKIAFGDTFTVPYQDLIYRARDVLNSDYHLFLNSHTRLAYWLLAGEMVSTDSQVLLGRMEHYGMAVIHPALLSSDNYKGLVFDSSAYPSSSFLYDAPGLMKLQLQREIVPESVVIWESFRLGHGTTLHLKKTKREEFSNTEEDDTILEEMEARILKELRA